MSGLEGLVGKPQTKVIGEVELTLVPLTLEDFDIVMKAASDNAKEQMEGTKELVKRTLEKSYPDVTNPMGTIGLEHMTEVLNFVVLVNGLSTPEELDKALKSAPLQKAGKTK